MKDLSIEYAHIYTNSEIHLDHEVSIEILRKDDNNKTKVFVIMVDDYSFPDPSFDYESFSDWLNEQGFKPDILIRESQLIPFCDKTIKMISNIKLKEEVTNYIIKSKKYPCSLFIATWYLIRLGHIQSNFIPKDLTAKRLLNILPASFTSYENKGLEIIKSTPFSAAVNQITNNYFEGRKI